MDNVHAFQRDNSARVRLRASKDLTVGDLQGKGSYKVNFIFLYFDVIIVKITKNVQILPTNEQRAWNQPILPILRHLYLLDEKMETTFHSYFFLYFDVIIVKITKNVKILPTNEQRA
jgi:hypothetical protein